MFFKEKISKKKYDQTKRYLKLQNNSVISLTFLHQILSESNLHPNAQRIFENNDNFKKNIRKLKQHKSLSKVKEQSTNSLHKLPTKYYKLKKSKSSKYLLHIVYFIDYLGSTENRLNSFIKKAGNVFQKDKSFNIVKFSNKNEYYKLLLDNIRYIVIIFLVNYKIT